MKKFRADLHIHTLLSPCADLEMTPLNIISKAIENNIDIIGITDHNSTKNARLVKRLGEQAGIYTLTGAEVTSREEVHCLVFFEFADELEQFQHFIDEHLIRIPNADGHLGYQPVVDEKEHIVELIPWYLPAALDVGIGIIQKYVAGLNGLFIPAHVDRPANGLFKQLGFVPQGLVYDALGISPYASEEYVAEQYVIQHNTTMIRNSDAHYLKQIGEIYTVFGMEEISYAEIRMALNRQDNRFCEPA